MNLISIYRKKANLTQAGLADLCGWSKPGGQSRVGHYETGKRKPSLDDAWVIISALHKKGVTCTVEDLFPPASNSTPPNPQSPHVSDPPKT